MIVEYEPNSELGKIEMTRLTGSVTPKVLLVLLAALAATSCGRRGNLEPPPTAAVISVDEYGNEIEETGAPEKADRPFILDPLL